MARTSPTTLDAIARALRTKDALELGLVGADGVVQVAHRGQTMGRRPCDLEP